MSEDIKDIWGDFWGSAEEHNTAKTSKFAIQPVAPSVFFRDWLNTPLFPRQEKAVDATFISEGKDISDKINELVLAWGKGSGKDLTIANLICYIVYWLCCLNDPSEYLGIKSGEPIDIVNVSFDAEQAKSVFFEKFTRKIKDAVNPVTGINFFESMGMDIDKAILKDSVIFPKNIRCWSLNSKEFKAEGKNVVFGIFDEIGTFRFDKAVDIHKHIKTSARTRCPKYYKLFFISYLTSGNDYMAYLIDKAENGATKTYFDRAATWEIRNINDAPDNLKKYAVKKETYQEEYDEDPATAMLMYECKIPKFRSNNFIKKATKITDCVNLDRPSPIIFPENENTDDTFDICWTRDILNEELQPWFRPHTTYEIEQMIKEYEKNPLEELEKRIRIERERHASSNYYVHIDLSRGVVDCAGLALAHTYNILDKQKIYVDLMLQIRAPYQDEEGPKEIDLESILDFVIKVLYKRLRFPIVKITADGWNSKLFLNICEKHNIEAKMISLEKDTGPYDTLKDYVYREDIGLYMYSPAIRELTELIVTDKKKIDHPRKSKWRMRDEGLNLGSKDISDCLAGIAFSVTEENDDSPLEGFGK
jgi:hypothetical protein